MWPSFVTWHENCAGRCGAVMVWAVHLWSLGSAQPICTALVVGYKPSHGMTNVIHRPLLFSVDRTVLNMLLRIKDRNR